MAKFKKLLSTFPSDPNLKGRQFEIFAKWFLTNDPIWKTQVAEVWLWNDYPQKWGRDLGIDLVFRHKSGDLWAVQAKCYSEDNSITKAHIDSFLSESAGSHFKGRLLIATTNKVAENARRVCDRQGVIRLLLSDLEDSLVDYPAHIGDATPLRPPRNFLPRRHQKKAVEEVRRGFENANRGQLVMACGTGKTLTSLWIKEALTSNLTLVLVPSLSLLSQTLREWTAATSSSFDVLCVCSDATVGKRDEDEIYGLTSELPFPVTSDISEISTFIQADSPRVVFSTYQSADLITSAQVANPTLSFDLIIADEAHRCAGAISSSFSDVLAEDRLRGKKRLFCTATPRIFTPQVKKSAAARGVEVVGMDDESTFGRVFYKLSFGAAIASDPPLLTDYRVVITGVDSAETASFIERREILSFCGKKEGDAESIASILGVLKSCKTYNLKKLITFHSRVSRAESFAEDIQALSILTPPSYRLDYKLVSDTVSAKLPTSERRKKLDLLRNSSSERCTVLTNAKCLSEGVDVPSLDGVAFVDPKHSAIDIIQAVGRAIRLSQEKTVGTIILPVFIQPAESPEAAIEKSNFAAVWGVISALKSHDEDLAIQLEQARYNLGRTGRCPTLSSISGKIHFDLPITVGSEFAEALTTQIVERTTSSWDEWYGLLISWREETGGLVPEVKEQFRGRKLGQWVGGQRSLYLRGMLSQERIEQLQKLEGWVWNQVDELWERGLRHLEAFVDRNGHARVPDRHLCEDSYNLGNFVRARRRDYKKGVLTKSKEVLLSSLPGWTWDLNQDTWQECYQRLLAKVKHVPLIDIERDRADAESKALRTWIVKQKSRYILWQKDADPLLRKRLKKLSNEETALLEGIPGWSWNRRDDAWDENYQLLEDFLRESDWTKLTSTKVFKEKHLGRWIVKQRGAYKRGVLSKEKISRLTSLGWVANPFKDKWETAYAALIEYKELNKNLLIPQSCVFDGISLGRWVSTQRSDYKAGTLRKDRAEKLSSIEGWLWDASEFSASGISKRGVSPSKYRKKL